MSPFGNYNGFIPQLGELVKFNLGETKMTRNEMVSSVGKSLIEDASIESKASLAYLAFQLSEKNDVALNPVVQYLKDSLKNSLMNVEGCHD